MTTQRNDIVRPAGFRSQEAALVIAQMDDQLRLLRDAVKDITVEEIEWQPRPGMNTIGMLLAHLAIVEVWWTMFVVKKDVETDLVPILGIDADDDGMPLEEGGEPPAKLTGKDFAFFDDLLERARKYVKEAAAGVTDGDLTHEITRTRADGSKRVVTVRWYLYHISEHFSGHYGQILLLRHLYRTARVPSLG
jgi:uncharacterized damage-inducible protein DinB